MSDHLRPPVLPALTRRAAVAGAVAALTGVAGCDPDRGGGTDVPGVSAGALPGAVPGADADGALVERVTGQVTELLGLVTAVEARFPSLAPRVRPLRSLHTAHLRALDVSTPAPSAAPDAVAGLHSPGAALRLVTARERLGRQRLGDAAVAAASGTLARLLASMAAGVAQQLAQQPALRPSDDSGHDDRAGAA